MRSDSYETNKVEELVQQGTLDYNLSQCVPDQALSWLNETTTVLRKEMPPRKKRKVDRSEFESKLVSSQSTAKGFLQNRQMGKACKKNWDSDIPYIRNVFTFLTVWLNPIRIDAKLGSFCNPVAAQWVYYMWSTMMPDALNEYFSREKVRRDLGWKIKENTALNEVHDFIEKANSILINTIYYFVNEEPIQNEFIQELTTWQANIQGGWLSLPQPSKYPSIVVEQKPIDCSKEVDKSTKGLNKKQRDKERKIALEPRLSKINALAKKHKDFEKEFQNNSLKLNFKL